MDTNNKKETLYTTLYHKILQCEQNGQISWKKFKKITQEKNNLNRPKFIKGMGD